MKPMKPMKPDEDDFEEMFHIAHEDERRRVDFAGCLGLVLLVIAAFVLGACLNHYLNK